MLLTGRRFVAPAFMYLEVTSAIARRLDPALGQLAYANLRRLQRMQYVPIDEAFLQRSMDIEHLFDYAAPIASMWLLPSNSIFRSSHGTAKY